MSDSPEIFIIMHASQNSLFSQDIMVESVWTNKDKAYIALAKLQFTSKYDSFWIVERKLNCEQA